MIGFLVVLAFIWFVLYALYLLCEGAHYGNLTDAQRKGFGRARLSPEQLAKRRRC